MKEVRGLYIVCLRVCRYREIRYEENHESLTVMNTSPLDADIAFCFLHDSKGDTFLLDPPNMLLKPGEKQVRHTFTCLYICSHA